MRISHVSLLWDFKEMMHVKCLSQGMPHSKCSEKVRKLQFGKLLTQYLVILNLTENMYLHMQINSEIRLAQCDYEIMYIKS